MTHRPLAEAFSNARWNAPHADRNSNRISASHHQSMNWSKEAVSSSGKNWRKELLENNTLLSVITFPEDLFYPVSVGTIGVFIKKGIPHNFKNQNVYFARAITDGLRKKKGKRIRVKNSENKLNEVQEELKSFLVNQNLKFKNVPEFKKICKLDKEDISIELVPEAHIDSKIPALEEIENGVEEMIREAIAFKIKYFNKLENKK